MRGPLSAISVMCELIDPNWLIERERRCPADHPTADFERKQRQFYRVKVLRVFGALMFFVLTAQIATFVLAARWAGNVESTLDADWPSINATMSDLCKG